MKLQELAYGQQFVGGCGAVIVCCVDLEAIRSGRKARVRELAEAGAVSRERAEFYETIPDSVEPISREERAIHLPYAMLNLSLAVENICLQAVCMGLGTCIVRRMEPEKIEAFLALPPHIAVVELVAVGVPDENPPARPRLPLGELILNVTQNDFHPE